jgi:hypothetical protein
LIFGSIFFAAPPHFLGAAGVCSKMLRGRMAVVLLAFVIAVTLIFVLWRG